MSARLNVCVSQDHSAKVDTWKKYVSMKHFVRDMRVKDKRQIFQIIRSNQSCTHDSFLTDFGLTAGEFCIWQVLNENTRKKTTRSRILAQDELP